MMAKPIALPQFDVTLKLPGGEVLQLGRFSRKYAAIARNWHIAFLGLDDRPLYWFEEVPDEVMDWRGNSLTVWRSHLYEHNKRVRQRVRGEQEVVVSHD
jgi:hypothetical protein